MWTVGFISVYRNVAGCDAAVAVEARSAVFPDDVYWQDWLGVDLARVEESLREPALLAGWLMRQSSELIAHLEERAGLSPSLGSKRERAVRLIETGAGGTAVRQALICRHFMANRRREGLENALESIVAARPDLGWLRAARGDWVRIALEVADRAPECLLWFALWDRALRVRYREYRAGEPAQGFEPVLGRVDKEAVERALRKGFDGEALHCVDVVPHSAAGESLVFILHGAGARQRVRTLDGVRYVERVDWIVLRLADHGRRLWAHSRGELGARIAEAVVAEISGSRPVVYKPYWPQTGSERISRWAEELVRRDGDEVRLEEVDFILSEQPEVTWSIKGDVTTGLGLIGKGLGRNGRVLRVKLGFRENGNPRWSRFTVWVLPGAGEESRVVAYRGHGVSAAERRAFLAWMEKQGIECIPR